jgi:hypothetical protein
MSQPSCGIDTELNCPRGAFAVELLNALNEPFRGWRAVVARKDHIDFFGHPIQTGERHYLRTLGPDVVSVERLTALSMDRILWAVFGENSYLVKLCTSTIESRKAAHIQAMARTWALHDVPPGEGGKA